MKNMEVNMHMQLYEIRRQHGDDGWNDLVIDIKEFERKLKGYVLQSDFIYESHISLNIDGKFWLSEERPMDVKTFSVILPFLPKDIKAKKYISFMQPHTTDSTIIYYDQKLQKLSDLMNQTGNEGCCLRQASVNPEGYRFLVTIDVENILAVRTTDEHVTVSSFTFPDKTKTGEGVAYTISEQILLHSIVNEKELSRCEHYNDYGTQIWNTFDIHKDKTKNKIKV